MNPDQVLVEKIASVLNVSIDDIQEHQTPDDGQGIVV